MEHKDHISVFLDVLRTCIRNAWHEELGLGSEVEDDPEWDQPKLTFSMFNSNEFTDDEFEMVHDIHQAFDEPLTSHPIRLHLSPDRFFVGYDSQESERTVVTIETPTPLKVFTAVENYYRELGCPETDKVFVEALIPLDRNGSPEDVTIFMGS